MKSLAADDFISGKKTLKEKHEFVEMEIQNMMAAREKAKKEAGRGGGCAITGPERGKLRLLKEMSVTLLDMDRKRNDGTWAEFSSLTAMRYIIEVTVDRNKCHMTFRKFFPDPWFLLDSWFSSQNGGGKSRIQLR